jgi:Myb-like DNA-binding domain
MHPHPQQQHSQLHHRTTMGTAIAIGDQNMDIVVSPSMPQQPYAPPGFLCPPFEIMGPVSTSDVAATVSAATTSAATDSHVRPVSSSVSPLGTAAPDPGSSPPALVVIGTTDQSLSMSEQIVAASGAVTAPDRVSPGASMGSVARMRREERRRDSYTRFTTEEEALLMEGVRAFGAGNWKQILASSPAFHWKRTPVDLKDKWRNLTRARQRRPVAPCAGSTATPAAKSASASPTGPSRMPVKCDGVHADDAQDLVKAHNDTDRKPASREAKDEGDDADSQGENSHLETAVQARNINSTVKHRRASNESTSHASPPRVEGRNDSSARAENGSQRHNNSTNFSKIKHVGADRDCTVNRALMKRSAGEATVTLPEGKMSMNGGTTPHKSSRSAEEDTLGVGQAIWPYIKVISLKCKTDGRAHASNEDRGDTSPPAKATAPSQ